MKKLENLILRACGFAIVILTLFYTFVTATNSNKTDIDFANFSLILGFGLLISLASMILEIKSIKLPLRIFIHYVVLLITFCVVFIPNGNISPENNNEAPSKLFTAIVLYTISYAVLFSLFAGFKKLINAIDNKIDSRTNKNNGTKSKAETKKSTYKSLYSDK